MYSGTKKLSQYSGIMQVLPHEAYAIVILFTFFSSTVTPILVKTLYDPSKKYAGYQKRNVSDLKPNSELKIVVGIHDPKNIKSITSLIDACNPTKKNPIIVYAIHLVEIFAQGTPIFISHQLQSTEIKFKQNIIFSRNDLCF